MFFRETVMSMIGERRLTGRVDVGWTAALFHLRSGSLWVAEVADAGPSGVALRLDAPIEQDDSLELCLRDARGRQAQVAGRVAFSPRSLDRRFGVTLTQLGADYIDLVVHAFQAEALASREPGRRVDYGLADVMPLPVAHRAPDASGDSRWKTRELADVIPYRRTAVAGALLSNGH